MLLMKTPRDLALEGLPNSHQQLLLLQNIILDYTAVNRGDKLQTMSGTDAPLELVIFDLDGTILDTGRWLKALIINHA